MAFRETVAAAAGDACGHTCTKDDVSIVSYARRAVVVSFAVQTETAEEATAGSAVLTSYLSSTAFTTALKSKGGGLAGVITASGSAVQPALPVNTTSTGSDETTTDEGKMIVSLMACLIFAALMFVPCGYWYFTVLNEVSFELVPPAPLSMICEEVEERIGFVNPYLPVGGKCWVALEEEKKKEKGAKDLRDAEIAKANPHVRHNENREDY